MAPWPWHETRVARHESRAHCAFGWVNILSGHHLSVPVPVLLLPILLDLDPRADAHYGSIIFNLLWSPNWRSLTARNCGQVVFEVALPVAAVSAVAVAVAAAISGWIDMSASCHIHIHSRIHIHRPIHVVINTI